MSPCAFAEMIQYESDFDRAVRELTEADKSNGGMDNAEI